MELVQDLKQIEIVVQSETKMPLNLNQNSNKFDVL